MSKDDQWESGTETSTLATTQGTLVLKTAVFKCFFSHQ